MLAASRFSLSPNPGHSLFMQTAVITDFNTYASFSLFSLFLSLSFVEEKIHLHIISYIRERSRQCQQTAAAAIQPGWQRRQ
jgi:hypothetical protein